VADYTEAGPGEPGTLMVIEWEINGQRFAGINGGPEFSFSEAVSFQITCADQDEVDLYWSRLTDGGTEGPCGWCKDRYGLSWQVVPTAWRSCSPTRTPAGRPAPCRRCSA
jgi:predicted 3-demethylubiquinone-9 3-methyltransferase (glyoxalase superfamily)